MRFSLSILLPIFLSITLNQHLPNQCSLHCHFQNWKFTNLPNQRCHPVNNNFTVLKFIIKNHFKVCCWCINLNVWGCLLLRTMGYKKKPSQVGYQRTNSNTKGLTILISGKYRSGVFGTKPIKSIIQGTPYQQGSMVRAELCFGLL